MDDGDCRTLSGVCELIVDCEHKTAPTQDTGYPSIRTPNIGRGRLILDSVNRVSEETYRLWTRRAVPRPGDLILAREAPVGNVAIVRDGQQVCLGQRTVLIRPDRMQVDPQYLTYVLLGNQIQAQFHAYASGATVPHLNMADIRALPLPELPAISTQRKIAVVLSGYDDLIENNTRRIEILEEMAQAIYREWFVHFRFPGHEDVPLVDSEIGLIPAGWPVSSFADLVDINPRIVCGRDSVKPYVAMAGLSTGSMTIESEGERTGRGGSRFENKDVLFPRITPSVEHGKSGFVQFLGPGETGIGSTEFIVFRAVDLVPEYVYFLSRQYEFRQNAINSMVGASGRQRVQYECFDHYLLPKPPYELLQRFSKIAAPFFELVQNLVVQSAVLRRTRDLLLPRLVAGGLDVSNLDVDSGDFAG